MSYELGKYAALEDAVDLWEAGAGLSDVLEAIDGTLSAPMDKYASYGEDEYRLGVDAMCYEILKTAHDLYGGYDVSGLDDDDLLEVVLEKVAADEEEEAASRRRRNLAIGGGLAAGLTAAGAYRNREALGNVWDRRKRAKGISFGDHLRNLGAGFKMDRNKRIAKDHAKAYGKTLTNMAERAADTIGDRLNKGKSIKKQVKYYGGMVS